MFYSQSGQDKWVCDFFNYKKNGYFVEVGAYDGIQTSNTYYLEKELGWNGICIEANLEIFKILKQNRQSNNINVAVSSNKGLCNFNGDRINTFGHVVECDTLNSILYNNSCKQKIDYLSLDIEGMEYEALKSLDFNYWYIKLITVEHNLYCTNDIEKNKIYDLLSSKNFERVIEDVKCLDPNPIWFNKPYEDWYVNRNIL